MFQIVTKRHTFQIIRTEWDLLLDEGVTAKNLKKALAEIPDDAVIIEAPFCEDGNEVKFVFRQESEDHDG